MVRNIVSLMVACLVLAGCAGGAGTGNLPTGAAAYGVIPAASQDHSATDYRIGPLDNVDITVFQEPELSVKALQVDASGNIAMPLVGNVQASGKTATELSAELEKRLAQKYLVNPQVTVAVAGSVSQKVTVQGEVIQPGVYEIKGPTTLLEALSMAKGETRVAALKEVVVFRNIQGKRMGAVFDINSIRRGDAQDPAVLGNDVVVVGYSGAKSMWRDILTASPLLNVFTPIAF